MQPQTEDSTADSPENPEITEHEEPKNMQMTDETEVMRIMFEY